MTTRRTRTRIEPPVRQYIEQEARADRSATAGEIRARIQRRLRRNKLDLLLPKDRTIQVIAKRARGFTGPTPDDPWSLGVRDPEIRAEYTGGLLAMWRVSLIKGVPLTIRQARWASWLRPALPAASIEDLLRWASVYERYERSAEIEGQHLDTTNLDAELAFKSWKSPLNRWAYQQAVLTDQISESPRERYEAWQMEDFFLAEAQDFLEQAAGDHTVRPGWWEHAEAVVCFWLRRIRATTDRWAMLDQISPEELSKEVQREWQEMGVHLARLVIEKARALEEADAPNAGASISLVPAGQPNWMPTEVLKEIGYES
ncbi:MAG: hypothetical protein QGI09_01975 [Dehalococcoidia bacterium]|nr:hypothetical protein [Dehalococcoidia bacterium]